MEAKNISQGILNAILKLGLITLGIFLLIELKVLLVYLVVAAIISLIGRPIVLFLRNKLKFSNLLAASVSLLVLGSLLFGIISLFIPLVIQQGENLSLLNLNELEYKLEKLMNEISLFLNLDPTNIEQYSSLKNFINTDNLGVIPEFLNHLLSLLGSFTIGLFSVTFISFFLLKDSHILENAILVFVNEKSEGRLKKSFEKIKNLLSRYFLGLLLQITILLIMYSIILLLFGIKNAIVIAFLCALLNLIPYIGPLIGAVLMMFLTMTSNLEADFSTVILPKTIYVMIGFFIGQLIDNFFSQPFIFSNSVKSHPLEIFIVILAGGTLMGTTGMIVAIPLYTALKVIFKAFLSENKIVKSLTQDL
ncbi:MAG: AI-2E family transporter [Flavobacteriaceae bacterium]|jgi:predicted PurR-regulated permease PerM|nr:AI-2E family transporter [Flavobacteriaceae bacterium]MDG1028541.1 AI-2E family transporter [Flavobacteriaceae bacterium]MDG1941667.1 AI-2E family transporter [Flavobacteriaceae bacterium]NCF31225.1 AI-2E family transporter [Bacteroidota bacterium]